MTSSRASGIINIKQTFFDYPELTKITGESTLTTFLKMKNELKANAQSVPSALGGVRHGHLGLVLTTDKYETVAHVTPYIKPIFPTLNTETGDTQFQLAQKRHKYETKMLTYRESIAEDRIIIQKIVNALDDKFLKALQDWTTNQIIMKISDILIYLFDTYKTFLHKR